VDARGQRRARASKRRTNRPAEAGMVGSELRQIPKQGFGLTTGPLSDSKPHPMTDQMQYHHETSPEGDEQDMVNPDCDSLYCRPPAADYA